jgi:hypothetical protein
MDTDQARSSRATTPHDVDEVGVNEESISNAPSAAAAQGTEARSCRSSSLQGPEEAKIRLTSPRPQRRADREARSSPVDGAVPHAWCPNEGEHPRGAWGLAHGRTKPQRQTSATRDRLVAGRMLAASEAARARQAYVDLAFDAGRLNLTAKVRAAAAAFDMRHRTLTDTARESISRLTSRPGTDPVPLNASVRAALVNVRRNRLVVDEKPRVLLSSRARIERGRTGLNG